MKILVLTKSRLDYFGNPFGLNNSARFITLALGLEGHHVESAPCVDGNSIDAAVTKSRPDIVIIEALWVTPAKMAELSRLHKHVEWVVRIHSNIPFLAMEGMAIGWIKELAQIERVSVVANNDQTAHEIANVFNIQVPYLPNIYHRPAYCPHKSVQNAKNKEVLHVSCFGAIRPFKNHLPQAMAAIWAAEMRGQILHFHINATRVEQKGDSVLRNIIACFEGTKHTLVEHSWQPHDEFLETVSKMDIGLQVSFTESFNIVAADHVHVGVPVVVSDQIGWLADGRTADPTNIEDIADAIYVALKHGKREIKKNTERLAKYNQLAGEAWHDFLQAHDHKKHGHGHR
jgi:glycosyltransferase involved in cell wall biosynthesis